MRLEHAGRHVVVLKPGNYTLKVFKMPLFSVPAISVPSNAAGNSCEQQQHMRSMGVALWRGGGASWCAGIGIGSALADV
jgi:hypothetical protein